MGTQGNRGFLSDTSPRQKLHEILTRLREVYCGPIGYEYMHIPDRERCNWLRERIEVRPGSALIISKLHSGF